MELLKYEITSQVLHKFDSLINKPIMELIEKVKSCLIIVNGDKNSNFVPESLVEYKFERDADFPIIIEKIRKFNGLMDGLVGNEWEKFLDKDFDTDIWPLL